MKARELITKLQELPPDAEILVVAPNTELGCYNPFMFTCEVNVIDAPYDKQYHYRKWSGPDGQKAIVLY